VREVGRGADEEYRVGGDQAADAGDVRFVGWGGAGCDVQFYGEVGGCFAEGCVCCFGDDPGVKGVLVRFVLL